MASCKRIGCTERASGGIWCAQHGMAKQAEAPNPSGLSIEGPIAAEPMLSGKHRGGESLLAQAGRKGGRARAAKLTPGQRSAIARRAAAARWGKPDEAKGI